MTADSFHEFAEYTKRLEELAEPSSNDIRYGQYVYYINCFISKFVDEKAYLVGSTAEQSKLSFSKDNGDADVLMVSGKLQVSADTLEYKIYNRCYVWILADECIKDMELQLVDNKYLSANLLRELPPELFTMLRAIHSQITACLDRLPDAGRTNSIVSVPSKVGLVSTCYKGLKLDGTDVQCDYGYCRKDVLQRSQQIIRHLIKRWENVKVHENDKKMFERVFKVLKCGQHPGGRGQPNGQFAFVVQAVDDALSRPKLHVSKTTPDTKQHEKPFIDDSSKEISDYIFYENDLNDKHYENGEFMNMRATYINKRDRDFVPALKVTGEIKYMQQWKIRVKTAGWPEYKINEICSTDVFVVAKIAAVNPNIDKDFCLSFNLAELKLAKMMTCVQRRVYLILKSFLKGIFEENHKKEGFKIKLKTYHIKTLLFWLYESEQHPAEGDNPETVYALLQQALDYLRKKLIDKELLHYFIPSNLFIDFEIDDFRLLIECVDFVKYNPVVGMRHYFELDDDRPAQKSVTPEELRTILEMLQDGGRGQLVDKIEDAIIDIFRGFNESKRDEEGRAPIKEALIDTFRLFFNDEKHVDLQIFKQINTFLRSGFTETDNTSLVEVNKRIKDAFVLIEGLGIFMPKINDFMTMFGGRPGLQTMLEGAFTGKPLDFNKDFGEQILETIDRYMSCSDETEDAIAAELKYKCLGYFSGRKEFPFLSSLRI